MKILKEFKSVVIVGIFLTIQIPQSCKAEHTTISQLYGQTAVITSLAFASSAACFFGLVKIFNPPTCTKKVYKDLNNKSCSLDKAFGYEKSKIRPFINKTEAVQGSLLFGLGLAGLWGSWQLAQKS